MAKSDDAFDQMLAETPDPKKAEPKPKKKKMAVVEKESSVYDDAPVVTELDRLKHIGKNNKYRIVKTNAALKSIISKIPKNAEIGVDTETSGLDRLCCDMYGYSFSWRDKEAYWVPLSSDKKLTQLSRLIKNRTAIFFNAGFDIAIIERFGGKVNDFWDVAIACYFADALKYKQSASLKAQASMRLGAMTVELKPLLKAKLGKDFKSDQVDFMVLNSTEQRIYASQDADITLQLWKLRQIQQAVEQASEDGLWQLEMDLVRPIMNMELAGVDVDIGTCLKYDEKLKTVCDEISDKVQKFALKKCKTKVHERKKVFVQPDLRRLTAKTGINLASAPQKQILLFHKDCLALPVIKKTDKGQPCCDSDTLDALAHKNSVVPLISKWTKFHHRRIAYTRVLPNKVSSVDGRLHASFWQNGTVSGRFSCSGPNLQGISKDSESDAPVKIRNVFVAGKGEVLITSDYNQMELRIAASLSGEEWLIDKFMREADIHAEMAMEIYNTSKPTSDQRSHAKTCNFSILTGISAYTLAKQLQKSPDYCEKLIDKWFKVVPRLRTWIRDLQTEAEANEFAMTYFGRIRDLPHIKRPTRAAVHDKMKSLMDKGDYAGMETDRIEQIAIKSLRNSGKRYALSHVIQGTAADIIKIAMRRVDRDIRESGLPITMWATVHDELCFRTKDTKTNVNKAISLIREAMTYEREGWVPLTVDINHAKRWGDCK